MVCSEESLIITNFVTKIKSTSPYSCEFLPKDLEYFESDADVAFYQKYVETGRVEKINKCALDAFSVIRDFSQSYADLHWNPGLKTIDIYTFKVIYPILRSSLDCLLNQLNSNNTNNGHNNINNHQINGNNKKFRANKSNNGESTDSGTLTYEGLFLLIKTSLEFIHPLAYSTDGVVLSQLINLLGKTAFNYELTSANLVCITVYLCRLYLSAFFIKLPENTKLIFRQHSVMFDRVIAIAVSRPEKALDFNVVLFINRVINTILYVINGEVRVSDKINEELVVFMSKFIDFWYCALVRFLINCRNEKFIPVSNKENSTKSEEEESVSEFEEDDSEEDYSDSESSSSNSDNVTQYNSLNKDKADKNGITNNLSTTDKDILLIKICKLIHQTPKLPPSHRMRLITQVLIILNETSNTELQIEAINCIVVLLDFTKEVNSSILKCNLMILLNAILKVVVDKIDNSVIGVVEVVDNLEIEKFLSIVYCTGQVLHNLITFKYEYNEEFADKFLSSQLQLIDTSNEIINKDCVKISFETISNIIKLYNELMKLNDETIDEAISTIISWAIAEIPQMYENAFEHILKLSAPICCLLFKTKKERIIEGISGKFGNRTTTTQIALSSPKRWAMGSKILQSALSTYLQNQSQITIDVMDEVNETGSNHISSSNETDSNDIDLKYAKYSELVKSMFETMFDSFLNVMVECCGEVEQEVENCLGSYLLCFGLEDYLKRLPLTNLYEVPITSENYHSKSYRFMLPVLKRQLKGFKLSLFPEYILPVLNRIQYFVTKTSKFNEIVSNITNNGSTPDTNNSSVPIATNGVTSDSDEFHLLTKLHEEYERIYNELLSLLLPLSMDTNAITVLTENNYLVLKYIVDLLSGTVEKFNIACRVISNLSNLEPVAMDLIGILVKRYIEIEGSGLKNLETWNMCDGILTAIGNVAKYCPSENLSKNLQSFEKALGNRKNDCLIKLSKALLPSVPGELKCRLHQNFLKQPRNRFIYIAIKTSIETAQNLMDTNPEMVEKVHADLAKEELASQNGNNVDYDVEFVKSVVSIEGMTELVKYLELLSETVDTSKQRILCLHSYTKLLHFVKTNFTNVSYSKLVNLVTNPLIFESIINSYSTNKVNRTCAFSIYELLCLINKHDDVLKITISTMYYNHNNVNKDCELINIGIVKLLCNIYSKSFDKFDNFETIRLVIYLSTRIPTVTTRFYVQILKFFRIVMVNMNHDNLVKLTPNIMKLFNNEKCCLKAKIYVRRLVEKMLTRLNRDYFCSVFPKEHFSLVTNIIQTRNRRFNKAIYSSQKGTKNAEEEDEDEYEESILNRDDGEPIVVPDEEDSDKEMYIKPTVRKIRERKTVFNPKPTNFSYIKLNRRAPKKEQIKVLKNIMKNKNK
ncbi:uncharacterized protein TA04305 [Theileria annulata]|uniref:NUC173 domain containing protein n=1 Tax=Theileria annulata TaxID=5874 RepID=Q4UC46_THEAN|nr:uncharacterized protein TA04305 [Theileria annulata]CAI75605.1 hypothetical protein, conserved [Theileria annulata]|eukprot:XP_955081.1 hypothetical protein, conserved [Theileria annulata]